MILSRLPPRDRLVMFAFAVGVIPASLPLFIYIDDGSRDLTQPVLILAAVACLHALLLVRSYCTVAAFIEATADSPDNQSVSTLWWKGVRRIWLWHLNFGVLRFGLVIMFSQYLHTSSIHMCRNYGLNPFCFWSCNGIGGYPHSHGIYATEQLLSAVGVIFLFSLFEAGLSSAIAIYAWGISPASALLWTSLGTRAILLIVAVMIYRVIVYSNSTQFGTNHVHAQAVTMCNLRESPTEDMYILYTVTDQMRAQALPTLLRENLAIIPFTLVDNGTLLSADIMRQSWSRVAIVQRIPAVLGGLLLYALLIVGLLKA